ncbi:MAG: signal peptide peptidase SppA [Gammaproteobacteria bacterium]|nr:signal peptide peptidase SppA [Gammaproteobacteria bacterium]
MATVESPFRQFVKVLDTIRSIVLNTLFLVFMMFLLLLFLAVAGLMAEEPPMVVADGSALVIAPEGLLVEEFSGEPVERALSEALGDGVPQVRMRDLTDAIKQAANDPRIDLLALDFDSMGGGGPAMYDEIAAAVRIFRNSDKPVVAIGDSYDQLSYRVAAEADEVYLHPMGMVFLRGYGAYRNYYKDLLARFEVEWNVFHAGEFKSFGEPYVRNDMSPEAREANLVWLTSLWENYTGSVEAARELSSGEVDAYIESLASGEQGDFAELARDHGLVDGLLERGQMKMRVAELMSLPGGVEADIPQVGYREYIEAQRAAQAFQEMRKPKVAVVVAEGDIVMGDQPPGVIAAERLIRDIRNARENPDVKAVVLRVNSGGGSAFASDLIQAELIRTQAAGKPLVVSMGTAAASGGYWISMTADRIFAQPTTITGSIGVVAMVPTFEQTLGKYGVYTDGVGTTSFAGALRLDRDLSDNVKRTLQASVDDLYQQFITEVSNNRGIAVEEVDRIARGRVWSGETAIELGLVDASGTLDEAVAAAAELAGMSDYATQFVEPELSMVDQFLINAFNTTAPSLQQRDSVQRTLMGLPAVRAMRADLERMARFQSDPRGLYATCFCSLP